MYYVFWYIELEYCHHQLPNEAKAEINYTPPPHIIRFFLFILFVEREYLSGLIDIRPLRSISTQEGVEELFF